MRCLKRTGSLFLELWMGYYEILKHKELMLHENKRPLQMTPQRPFNSIKEHKALTTLYHFR